MNRVPWTADQWVFALVGGIFAAIGAIFLVVVAFLADPFLRGDPADPSQGMAAAILGLIALFFIPIGIWLVTTGFRKRRNADQLLRDGLRTNGTIVGVEPNPSITINDIHPLRIRCTVPEPLSDRSLDLFSADWMNDPTPILDRERITTLPVYLDPNNPRERHYVDDRALRELIA